jgi:amino acid kinase family protein
MTEIDDHTLIPGLGRQLLDSSLNDAALMQATEGTPDYAILPWVNVVKIGGQSIMDRGRAAVYPLVEEIVANLGRHKMILGTGAGTRARHIYSLAIDLGLPTGVLTVLGTAVAWQNAQMLHYLLARHGIPFVEPEGFGTPASLFDGVERGGLPGHASLQGVGVQPARQVVALPGRWVGRGLGSTRSHAGMVT